MDFNNMIDSHRSQIRFYQLFCMTLIAIVGILAVIVPSSLKSGPYVIHESETLSTIQRSEPWKLTVARADGFLKLFLTSRFEWSKENFDRRSEALKSIVSDRVFSKLKDSIVSYGSLAKAQGARGFFILEGFRYSNEQHLIEAQVSRVIRIGTTGVVTPLLLRLSAQETEISDSNPYGLRIKVLEEGALPSSSEGAK